MLLFCSLAKLIFALSEARHLIQTQKVILVEMQGLLWNRKTVMYKLYTAHINWSFKILLMNSNVHILLNTPCFCYYDKAVSILMVGLIYIFTNMSTLDSL